MIMLICVCVCVCVCVQVCQLLSHVPLFETPWTTAHQAPLSIGFSTQVYSSGLSVPFPGDLPDLGLNPGLPHCRHIFYHLSHQGSPVDICLEYSPALSPPGNISLKKGKNSFSDLLTQLDCQNQTLSTESFPVIHTGL